MRREQYEELRNRVKELETNGGHLERRSDDAIFNDRETQRIKELFDERAEVHAGRAALRVFLWAAGSAIAGAATTVITLLGFKK